MLSNVRVGPLAVGIASYVPGVLRLRQRSVGGGACARYCYSVWLRHLVSAAAVDHSGVPRVVAELGPGDSLGTGLAALLSGAEEYIGLDTCRWATTERNLQVFEELYALFCARAPIPDSSEFPLIWPTIGSYEFPTKILTDAHMERALAPQRIARLRQALASLDSAPDTPIRYVVPWQTAECVSPGSVDMIFSQAVLQHVDDPQHVYRAMRKWLRQSGFMCHTIDFRSHHLTRDWNGHWTLSPLMWQLVRGNRPYLLNRQPLSGHLDAMAQSGFDVRAVSRQTRESRVTRNALVAPFTRLSEDDLRTSGAFVLAVPHRPALQ